ncbi:PHP domain-containing protein [Marinomonas agarivorans]|nr:PHP domain-containing protein [Marinomonas agarivorans]
MQESLLHRRVDLHCHSTFSDGFYTPTQIVNYAKEYGVELLALTDHDTIAGLPEAKVAAQKQGVIFVSGVEISVQWEGIPLHMVALNFDDNDENLLNLLEKNQTIRRTRAKKIAELLCKKGLPNLYEKVVTEAGVSQIGRPHFANVMVNLGLVTKHSQAFDRYLSNKHLGNLKSIWPEITSVMDILKGRCELVLAHPKRYSMTLTKLKRLLMEFSDLGGVGIEVASGNENPQSVRVLEDICREFGLKASVGSDFHGPESSWSRLGKYTAVQENNLSVIWHKWLENGKNKR